MVAALTPGSVDAATLDLAFHEAVRTLEAQASVLDGVRSRASTLFAVGAASTSFFGALATTNNSLDVFGWTAVGFFLLLTGAILSLLWPRRTWTFTSDSRVLVTQYADRGVMIPTAHRHLALHMGHWADGNQRNLDKMSRTMERAVVALGLEVALWVMSVVF